ncbi:MAG: carbohydrate kinase family protein [Lentisphaeria bacterium]|nr:carbohydrate kinase family protein [Lentisphaeria bacterium]
MKRAVVGGHICLDIIPDIDHPIELIPGRLFEVGAPTIATGGAVSNTGGALHILGIPTTLMGKVGDDSFGRSVLDVLAARDSALAAGMVVVPGVTTSYTVVVSIPGTDRMFLHCPGANESFVAADLDSDGLEGAALFHFGYPAFMAATYANDGDELVAMYKKVKSFGLTTSLDMGMPDPSGAAGKVDWRRVLERALPLIDIFMPSADELLYALEPRRFGEGDGLSPTELAPLAQTLLDLGSAVVSIKMGSRGMYLRTGTEARIAAMGAAAPANASAWANRELWFPVYQEDQFAGATGAGDTTIAGFLAALLQGEGVEDCGRMANAVGSCNVEAPDALGGLRSWKDTKARLAAGWQHPPFELDDEGWTCDPTGLWHGPADGAAHG